MSSAHFINWIERRGEELRTIAGVSAFGRLDPVELAKRLKVPVIEPGEIAGLNDDELSGVLVTGWDAATLPLPDGRNIIVVNPVREETRQRASLMEELAHIHLGHEPSKLISINGVFLRTLKKSCETEAFWVGAAALVPRRVLKGARRQKVVGVRLARESVALLKE